MKIGFYKIPCFETPRFQPGDFKTKVTVPYEICKIIKLILTKLLNELDQALAHRGTVHVAEVEVNN